MRAPLLFLLLVALLVPAVLGAFSCYRATPAVYIKPYSQNTRLLLDELISCLDTTSGTFLINSTTYFSDASLTEKLVSYGGDTSVEIFRQFAAQLPPVQLYGNLSFTEQGYMQFSYPNSSSLYCAQARSAPDLCPLLQTYTNGPFVFSADPSLSAPVMLTIQASQLGYVDPVTGVPYNFFYAPQPISLQCTSGSCASLANVVPPAPLPPNPVFNVRRFLLCLLLWR